MRHASLDLQYLQAWAAVNNVELNGVRVASNITDQNGQSKGGGIIATKAHNAGEALIKIPNDLILSSDQVEQCAKIDPRLRELLDAVPSLTQTERAKIVLFVLFQMTVSSPDSAGISNTVPGPLTDYVKFLPKQILLPTFYTAEEREMLKGTSLSDALDQKLASLEKEFDGLREATGEILWCRNAWWGDARGVSIDDWKLADALYRSRALDLPRGIGPAMLPVVDMANHASDGCANARFEVDEEGNALLVVQDEKSLSEGEEVTIMYGMGGACEVLFSYGFLEKGAESARELFLSLQIPDDDPLRLAKVQYAKEAPGVRLYTDSEGAVGWDSNHVWWACVNEEDGLDFAMVQDIEGERELQALWKGQAFASEALKKLMLSDELGNIFTLRATVLIEERVTQQGLVLAHSEAEFGDSQPVGVRATVWELVQQLQQLELGLLSSAQQELEAQKTSLLECEDVRSFLGKVGFPSRPIEERNGDFS